MLAVRCRTPDSAALRILVPAAAYVAIVFAVGFALGTVRVMLLAPRIGEVAAVACELPLMLAAPWLAAGWVLARWPLRCTGARLAMVASPSPC